MHALNDGFAQLPKLGIQFYYFNEALYAVTMSFSYLLLLLLFFFLMSCELHAHAQLKARYSILSLMDTSFGVIICLVCIFLCDLSLTTTLRLGNIANLARSLYIGDA